ncbi:hypothetical protein KMP13_11035 [Epibacterium ulvae]|uniref:hypothetical protein n=1 Tax=Epibacterium ulvae TaxID=1156985 RepID=UPI001BFC020E|nr:hypothetical protein [Epibacterium ulvae]MBT8154424.1 hypothetical protein [Epibacterium ulvae]
MSILAQTIKVIKTAKVIRSKSPSEQVRILRLTEDEDMLPRIQREIASQSLQARAPL